MSLSKKSKWIFSLLILGCIAFYSAYKYAYKPHKTTESLQVDFTGSSDEFLEKIKEDASIWNTKAVQLTGIITSKDDKGITLSNSIYCQFRKDINTSNLNKEQKISIKGRVIGYDDLLEELKLDQCIIQE